ncbi:MAG: hypothetical protein AMS25_16210, partial [Gemmatimonas sp. SM23_52]
MRRFTALRLRRLARRPASVLRLLGLSALTLATGTCSGLFLRSAALRAGLFALLVRLLRVINDLCERQLGQDGVQDERAD